MKFAGLTSAMLAMALASPLVAAQTAPAASTAAAANAVDTASIQALKDMGYGQVYNVGAFKDWAESGGTVEK